MYEISETLHCYSSILSSSVGALSRLGFWWALSARQEYNLDGITVNISHTHSLTLRAIYSSQSSKWHVFRRWEETRASTMIQTTTKKSLMQFWSCLPLLLCNVVILLLFACLDCLVDLSLWCVVVCGYVLRYVLLS